MSTAVRSVRKGLDTALLADAAVEAMIADRVYVDSQKPEGATLPFISFGTPTEGRFNTFSADGNDGTRLLHLYGIDEDVVEALYEEVERVVREDVSLTGHVGLRLSCSLLSVSADPSGGAHGVVRVSALTQKVV
ncbi:MAG TPA: DUF3168 domain-containing protein [Gemmatimonadaceae bacterium]|nr:DUF3168 domain-containing protein [Gemmatimonadaceae bacterium]